jgi:hypothetical protein
MAILYFLLFLLGLVCFIVGAFTAEPRRINIVSLGLAFCAAAWTVQAATAAF